VDGGHAVLEGGYTGSAADDEQFITWGAETGFTDGFWSHLCDELWVVIWPEHFGSKAFLEGVDLAAVAADYTALTGRPFPVQPEPWPSPAPDTADTTLAAVVRVWSLARHSGANRAAATAVRAWLKAKGL